jgi:hypothetical protein
VGQKNSGHAVPSPNGGGLTAPTASYTATQQVTDFGSAQSSVTVNVYQLSAAVGRGYAGIGLV